MYGTFPGWNRGRSVTVVLSKYVEPELYASVSGISDIAPTASTPGTDFTLFINCVKNRPTGMPSGYAFGGSESDIVIRCCVWNPGDTSSSRLKLRINSPAPANS